MAFLVRLLGFERVRAACARLAAAVDAFTQSFAEASARLGVKPPALPGPKKKDEE